MSKNTRSIAGECSDTESSELAIDSLTYGKGPQLLKQ